MGLANGKRFSVNSKLLGIVFTIVVALLILGSGKTNASIVNDIKSSFYSPINNPVFTPVSNGYGYGCGCMPIIAISPTYQSKKVGQQIDLHGIVLSAGCGCRGSDAYQWFNDTTGTPVAITGATSLHLALTAGATGNFEYYIQINDHYNLNQSSNAIVHVYTGCGCSTTTTVPTTTTICSCRNTTTIPTTTTTILTTVPPTTTVSTTTIQSYNNGAFTGGAVQSTSIPTTTTVPVTAGVVTSSSTTPTTTIVTVTIPQQVPLSSTSVLPTSTVPVTIVSNSGKYSAGSIGEVLMTNLTGIIIGLVLLIVIATIVVLVLRK